MKSKYFKSVLLLFTVGLSLLSFYPSIAQDVTLKSGAVIERRILKGLSQNISVGTVRGTLQWQLSTDGVAWQNMPGKTQSNLTQTPASIIYLRCAIKEPICDVVYSDVIKLIPFDQPIVTTAAVTAVSGTSATCGGTVVSDENSTTHTIQPPAVLRQAMVRALEHSPAASPG